MKTPTGGNFKDNLEEFLREETCCKSKLENESKIV
jgi:hypothetical protein